MQGKSGSSTKASVSDLKARARDIAAKDIAAMARRVTAQIFQGWLETDMPIIRDMHPEALAVIPLYRSALVVLPPEGERGATRILVYHDPAWIGEKPTPEAFREHCWELIFNGQRNGPDILWKANCNCSVPRLEEI